MVDLNVWNVLPLSSLYAKLTDCFNLLFQGQKSDIDHFIYSPPENK